MDPALSAGPIWNSRQPSVKSLARKIYIIKRKTAEIDKEMISPLSPF